MSAINPPLDPFADLSGLSEKAFWKEARRVKRRISKLMREQTKRRREVARSAVSPEIKRAIYSLLGSQKFEPRDVRRWLQSGRKDNMSAFIKGIERTDPARAEVFSLKEYLRMMGLEAERRGLTFTAGYFNPTDWNPSAPKSAREQRTLERRRVIDDFITVHPDATHAEIVRRLEQLDIRMPETLAADHKDKSWTKVFRDDSGRVARIITGDIIEIFGLD